jgi:hypothetical protein
MMKSRSWLRTTKRIARKLMASPLQRCSTLAIVIAAGTSTGCTMFQNISHSLSYSEAWNEAVNTHRFRNYSSRSWHMNKNRFCNEAALSDFADGYRQGYEDVAKGGNGCTPNFPPRKYWNWQYQSPYGQKQVAAWFAGYPHGARAAEEEGLGHWSQIQMSSNLQTQYANAGVLPKSDHAVYPIPEHVPAKPYLGAPTPAAGLPESIPGGVLNLGPEAGPAGLPGTPQALTAPPSLPYDSPNAPAMTANSALTAPIYR